MKKEQPQEIKELISLSRIGRSLGVHLILATQKPSGSIDEEIWSNSRFKIALKVNEERDSLDLIRSKDASFLQKAGSFILKVDESLLEAQSLFSKKDAFNSEPYQVQLLKDDLGIKAQSRISFTKGKSEAAYFTGKCIAAAEKIGMRALPLNFKKPLEQKRLSLCKDPCIVLGESDDYLKGRQGLVAYGFNEDLLICTSRKSEHYALINMFNEHHIRMVMIGAKRYEKQMLADSFRYDEKKDLTLLFDILLKVKEKTVLIIEDLTVFLSYDECYRDEILKLLKQKNDFLHLVALSHSTQIGFRFLNGFENKVLIYGKDPNDLSYLFSEKSSYKGDSFYRKEELLPFVPISLENYVSEKTVLKPLLKRIPEKIAFESSEKGILLGYDLVTRKPFYWKEKVTITSFDERLLDLYRKAYGNFEQVNIFKPEDLKKKTEPMLWLSGGLFLQHLFMASFKEDLDPEDALFIHEGKMIRLRCPNA